MLTIPYSEKEREKKRGMALAFKVHAPETISSTMPRSLY